MKLSAFGALALFAAVAAAQNQQGASTAQGQQGGVSTEPSTYEGPSILSRDRSLIGERGGKLLDYTFYGAVTGVYDSGLVPVSVNSSGQIPSTGAYGLEGSAGVTGSRTWRHDRLSLEYNGSARHYPNASYYDGIDQFLNLSYYHQFNRKFAIQTRETAGTTSLTNGYYTYLPLQNTDLFAVPTNELFSNRTDFLQSRLDLIWTKTPRLSFSFGGEGFYVRRRSIDLGSLNGYDAHGDIAYRVTRRQTLTVAYEFTAFNYLRQFGDANIHTFTAGYAIGLGRRWEFALQGGGARVDFSGLTLVNIDPAIAAIVGQNQAVVTFHRTSIIPVYGAQLTRRFERSAVVAAYNQTYNPGNGVFLTSRYSAASVSYSYVGLKRATFDTSLAYSKLNSLGQTLGAYNGYFASAAGTYKLASYSHLILRYDFRHYTVGGAGYRQNSSRITAGIAFSPASRPLPIW